MKYIQDDKLSYWTGLLTGVTLGHSRVLHGRVEVYSMKRAGTDKKYAASLGEKYVEQIHQDQEMAAAAAVANEQQQQHNSRNSTNNKLMMTMMMSANPPTTTTTTTRKRSVSVGVLQETEKEASNLKNNNENNSSKRRRSCSFDLALFPQKRPTALGDFTQQATRRLMTDLILTLNASFPDYDFGSVKASDFIKVKVTSAVATINHHLSEWARSQRQQESNMDYPIVLQHLWESVNESVPLEECDVYCFTPPDGSLITTPWEEEDDDEHTASTNLWSFYYLFVNKAQKRILLFTATEYMKATTVSDVDEELEERYIGVTEQTEPDGRFDLDPAAAPPGGIPVSSI